MDRSTRPGGAVAGGQFGYNFQAGAAVLGFEGDISWSGLNSNFNFSGTKPYGGEDFDYRETLRAKLEYFGTARARFGYAFGQFMPYATAGFAWGNATTDYNSTLSQWSNGHTTLDVSRPFAARQSNTLTGAVAGAGFEYAFAPHWSAKAEYLYVDLGRIDFLGEKPAGTVTFREHIARVGINFRLSP